MTSDTSPAEAPPEEPGAIVLTPVILASGWLGVMSPVVAWAMTGVLRGGSPGDWAGPALAVSLLGLVVAWPLGLLGAQAARALRDRRHADWPPLRTDAAGAYLAGTLGTVGFGLCTGLFLGAP